MLYLTVPREISWSSSSHDYIQVMNENQESQIRPNMPCEEENAEYYSRSRVLGENTSGNGRLCIKLKISKSESDQFEHEHHPSPAAAKCFSRIKADSFDHERVEEQASALAKEFPLVCNICNKVFGSGKALGGHTRMHVQARDKELLDKIQKSKYFKKHLSAAGDLSNASRAKTNASVATMAEPTCYVCGKKFPTMKALFGHMRSHPGREWRGILPPRNEKNSAGSSTSTPSDHDKIGSAAANFTTTEAPVLVDLSTSLFRWKSTGKRGRKSIPDSASVYGGSVLPQGLEEEGMQEAIHDLMMLANANPEKRLTDNSDPKAANIDWVLTEARDFSSRNDKLTRTDEAGSRREVLYKSINEKGKGKAMLETAPPKMRRKLWVNEDWPRNYYYRDETSAHKDLNRNDSGNCDLVPKDEISVKMMIRNRTQRKTKVMLGLKALGDAADRSHNQFPLRPSRYTCSLCNKSFPTHQALGGHMSSHNKLKYIQTTNEYVSENDSATEDYGNCANLITQVADGTETTVIAESTHQYCKICNVETFPTGQAVLDNGSHWTCPMEIDSSKSPGEAKAQISSTRLTSPEEATAQSSCQVTSSGDAKAQSSQVTLPGEASQTARRILGFDLNDLPAMEVEEGIVESIFDMFD